MDLRHLRYFLAVAEELNFSRAAERLGMEQSPLSRQIRELEAWMRVRLFHRSWRVMSLTPAGERFLTDLRRISADFNASVASARILAADADAPFRLGLAEGAAGEPFGRLLRACADHQPAIRVLLIERPPVELVAMVESGTLDAALMLAPSRGRELAHEVAWTEPLRLLLPKDHPLAARRSATLADLTQDPWVLPDRSVMPGLVAQIDAVLARHGIERREARRAAHFTTLGHLVAAGAGVGLVPASFAAAGGAVALPLDDPEAVVTTYFVARTDDTSAVLKQVRALIGAQRP